MPEAVTCAVSGGLCTLTLSRHSNRAVKKLMAETDDLTLAAGIARELHRTPGTAPISPSA